MPKTYQMLSERSLAAAMAMLAFLVWIVAIAWHGMLAQPSMMGYMYPGFSYMNPVGSVTLLVVFVVSTYILGWLLAAFYNWNLKRR